MPVLYVNLRKQNSLEKDPYAWFSKEYEELKKKGKTDGARMEFFIAGKEGDFANGFYLDECFYQNPRLQFDFATVPPADKNKKESVFVRLCYSYEEGEDCNDSLYRQRVKSIKKRVPYYYVPWVSCLEFSAQIDDENKLFFDALVEDPTKVPEACLSLINLVISIFSLDN